MEINYEFYDAISKAEQQNTKYDVIDDQINRLIMAKNKKIMSILNEDQQRQWLKSCYKDYILSNF